MTLQQQQQQQPQFVGQLNSTGTITTGAAGTGQTNYVQQIAQVTPPFNFFVVLVNRIANSDR